MPNEQPRLNRLLHNLRLTVEIITLVGWLMIGCFFIGLVAIAVLLIARDYYSQHGKAQDELRKLNKLWDVNFG